MRHEETMYERGLATVVVVAVVITVVVVALSRVMPWIDSLKMFLP